MKPYPIDPTGADIQGEIRALRELGPITPILLPDDVPGWAVTDDALLRTLMTDPRVSKSGENWRQLRLGRMPDGWPLAPWANAASGKPTRPDNMFHAEGALHRRLRGPARAAFAPRRITAMRPKIQEIAHHALDRVEEAGRDGQVVDLRALYAAPVPIAVISELLGLPDDDLGAQFRECVHVVFDTTATNTRMRANQQRLQGLLREFVARKKTTPGDDLTSDLVACLDTTPHDDVTPEPRAPGKAGPPQRLSEREVLGTVRLMITAGFETTVNALDQAIHALLSHPRVLPAVQAGEIVWDDVVEEALRYQAPVASAPFRFATAPITVGDVEIQQGDLILAVIGAAGRDPRTHHAPDRFDPTRNDLTHLAFGHGVHHCLGAPLARLEATVTLAALFDRFPGLTFAVDPAAIGADRGFIPNGHARLPVTLS